ncbi:hypothetical protein B7767_16785 [Streptomyces sp. 13-12-16]|uniref:hypothetical protein n=1 Tax=Streptomyces sp. 13-12-16 TaxID=1570823 RepID=UPI000A1E297E|nr:hypothetical protein [Streptomyces sp. 13-12-16]OSP42208.1 hypothetical protein B7767_16785 [Streptomyces sp. 13-12-16]
MRALPARRIALGALCAALLAGLTGPAAMAAEHDRAPSSTALLAQVRTVEADGNGLAPVVDLLKAVLETDEGRASSAEVGKLGDAARKALAEAADEDPVATTGATTTETTTTTEPSPSVTTTDDTQLTVSGDDLTSEEMAALREALDSLLELLRPDTVADGNAVQEPTLGSELAARVHDLVDALLGTGSQVSTLPAPAAPAQPPLLPGVTFPALTSLLLPPAASS